MSAELLKYKRLTDVEHVRKRPGVYIGDITNVERESYILKENKITSEIIRFNPGLIKIYDEIISNAVDEHIRSGNVNNIWVEFHNLTGEISVRDDGGIPVKQHPEYGCWIPEMIFGELRAGSNFDDDERVTAGLNGMGSVLTSICSSSFTVDTSDGSKRYLQTFFDGMSTRTEPKITKCKDHGTTITFIPDYEYFKCELDDGNIHKITRRVYDLAGCFPSVKFHINGEHVKIKTFEHYVKLYSESAIVDACGDFEVGIFASPDESFRHASFVNGIDTYSGGTHVDYVANQIVNSIREFIKKKHKIDVRPNIIKQQLFIVMKCKVNAPNFTSQTKECMIADVKTFGSTYTPSDKFIKKIITESDVIQKVLDWVEGEQNRAKAAELRKMNKETQNSSFLKRIENFDDATSKDRDECIIFFAEGLSAANSLVASRDAKLHATFPLRGKILNVRDADIETITKNVEIKNIMAIIGLKIGQSVPVRHDGKLDIRYGKICITSDYDVDGHHIAGLFYNLVETHWPELIERGYIYRLRTPIVVATLKNKKYEFFSESEYTKWSKENPGHTHKYFKGLGSFKTQDFKVFMKDLERYMIQLRVDGPEDLEALDLVFNKSRADDRKLWLLEE